jgi:predicted outer membrane repeat protein
LEDRVNPVNVNVTSLMDSGAGTLRDAIVQVNASNDATNTINITTPGIISLDSALPVLHKANGGVFVTISGMGSANTTVQRTVGAATNFRIFNVDVNSHVTISGMTVAKGTVGGILVNGWLTLTDSKVVDCKTTGVGGGIDFGGSGHGTLHNVVINGNSADGGGGGIYMSGSTIDADVGEPRLVMDGNSQITNNSTQGQGGGIYVGAPGIGRTDYIRIRDSSINQNDAKLEGGGLYFATVGSANAVDAAITNSNILENRSIEKNGGGIYTGAKLIVTGTTINGNKGALLAGYAIAVDTSAVAIPLELSQCQVNNSLHIPVGGGQPDPNSSAIDAGKGGIKFTGCLIMNNSGHGVSGTVVSGGGNFVMNSSTTSTGWLPFPLDQVF